MKNGNNDIHLLEQQMANNEDICCSCGNITSFPRAFFDNLKSASYLNGNLNGRKELEHYAS